MCDDWFAEYATKEIEFNESSIIFKKGSSQGQRCIFGREVIESGIKEWKIKFLTDIAWICIGIIEDNDEILKEYARRGCSYYNQSLGCFMLSGSFYSEGNPRFRYCDHKKDKGTVITMTLNMNQHTLNYKINDTDHGVATDKLSAKKYRLAVTLVDDGKSVELL